MIADRYKKKIEDAAKSVNGVTYANRDINSKILFVKYSQDKAKITDIHKAITKAGHDTDKGKASNESYANLPDCCRYDRKP